MDNRELARRLVKLAGQIAGPGIPDGTGPYGGTDECVLNTRGVGMGRKFRRTGPQDGTGPRGYTDECLYDEKLAKQIEGGRERNLDKLAMSIAKDVQNRINKEIRFIEADTPYKAQYVLEELIEILEKAV
jgi:hypothetical protein